MSASADWRIRSALPADYPAVRALILAGLGERFAVFEPSFNPDLDDLHAHYVARGALVIVAEGAGAVVGCGALIDEPGAPGVGRIVRMSVRADLRGRGLGRALGQHLIAAAGARGYRRLLVETNDDWYDALHLYQRLGFREYARAQAEGHDFIEVHMSLDLTHP